jgi:hypothetical protein
MMRTRGDKMNHQNDRAIELIERVRISIQRTLRNQYFRVFEGEDHFESSRTSSIRRDQRPDQDDRTLMIQEHAHEFISPEVIKRHMEDHSFSEVVLQRSNKDYVPKKETALALAIVLKMNPSDAEHLLNLAGYSFSRYSGRDIVVKICLEHRIYDLMTVNQMLYEYLFEPL